MPLLLISNGNKFLVITSQLMQSCFLGTWAGRSTISAFGYDLTYHAEAVSTCGQQTYMYMRFSIRISLLAFRQLMITDDAGATTGSKSELINSYICGHS